MLAEKVEEILKPLFKYRRIVILLGIIAIGIGLIPVELMGRLTSNSMLYKYEADQMEAYLYFISTITGVLILTFFADWLRNFLFADLTNRGAGIVRGFFFENVLHKKYRYFLDHQVGDINNKIINDSYTYVQTKLMFKPIMILNLFHILVIFALLFTKHIYMLAMSVLFSGILLGMYILINRHLRRTSLKEREEFSLLMDEANETIQGINTIQLYTSEDHFANQFNHSVERYEHELTKLKFWQTLSKATINAMTSIVPLAAITGGIVFLSMGGYIKGGDIVAFYYLLIRLKDPVKELADFNVNMQNAKAVEARLASILNREDIDNNKNAKPIDTINEIEFKEVTFQYEDADVPSLNQLNLTLTKGDIVAITGTSGKGKSTLLRLLKRQLEPTKGQIRINRTDYLNVERVSYIDKISVVTQEVFIFNGSVLDNIKFGREYSDEKVERALKISSLEQIDKSENAISLSGGEKQRIGIARAVLYNYEVMIMDEPTSELDEVTELQIIEALKQYQAENKKIIIVVTHSKNIIEKLATKVIEI